MSSEQVKSWVTGHHVYKRISSPIVGDKLNCRREINNPHDRWAVVVCKDQTIVGHVPRDLSKRFSEMLSAEKAIYAVVVGKRENKRKRGLEVPVIYNIS